MITVLRGGDLVLKCTVAVNSFVRRQTKASPFSYFDGPFEAVAAKAANVLRGVVDRKPGVAEQLVKVNDGVYHVKVDSTGFFSGVVRVCEATPLVAAYEARQAGDTSRHVVVRARGDKLPARATELVVYRRDTLKRQERSSFYAPGLYAEYELMSINARATAEPEPVPPLTMARNFLAHSGDTARAYSAAEFAESIWYWSKHAVAMAPLVNPDGDHPLCPKCRKADKVTRKPMSFGCARCQTSFTT